VLGSPRPGLVELIIIAVPDVSSTAPVAEALQHLVTTASIRILDIVVVSSEDAGLYTVLEFEEVAGLAVLQDVEGEVGGWLSSDDIALACDALPPRSTAILLVTEDQWAESLADAVRACGGQIVGGERMARRQVRPGTGRSDRGRRA
jgi:hypothetical protein